MAFMDLSSRRSAKTPGAPTRSIQKGLGMLEVITFELVVHFGMLFEGTRGTIFQCLLFPLGSSDASNKRQTC